MALTNKDESKIREIVKEEVNDAMDEKFMTFKSELFDRIDPILKEVTNAREERPLIETYKMLLQFDNGHIL